MVNVIRNGNEHSFHEINKILNKMRKSLIKHFIGSLMKKSNKHFQEKSN